MLKTVKKELRSVGLVSYFALDWYCRDTLAIAITNSATSIFAGFVIFSAFGYMSHLQNVPVSEIAVDGEFQSFLVFINMYISEPLTLCVCVCL